MELLELRPDHEFVEQGDPSEQEPTFDDAAVTAEQGDLVAAWIVGREHEVPGGRAARIAEQAFAEFVKRQRHVLTREVLERRFAGGDALGDLLLDTVSLDCADEVEQIDAVDLYVRSICCQPQAIAGVRRPCSRGRVELGDR